MKTGKKILAAVITLVLVLVASMMVANAADYTVKPGGSAALFRVKGERLHGYALHFLLREGRRAVPL